VAVHVGEAAQLPPYRDAALGGVAWDHFTRWVGSRIGPMARRDRFDGEFGSVLTGARAGEPWAFERIFLVLSPVVEGYLRLQGAREPEDLTSDVFVAVLRNLRSFRGDEGGFRSWVFTIAHRRLVDERRRARRRPEPAPIEDAPDLPAPDDVVLHVEQVLAAAEVRALCERLSPDQRNVVLLRLIGRLSIDEVAVSLGRTPGSVKALQRRGLLAIARVIEREGVSL
jgi:RNA polymerase sigma factor (sigma-70 family)